MQIQGAIRPKSAQNQNRCGGELRVGWGPGGPGGGHPNKKHYRLCEQLAGPCEELPDNVKSCEQRLGCVKLFHDF